MEDHKRKVLFLCTGNSCRSQMAEGILRHIAGDRFEALSAGLDPREEVHPMAIEAMKEVGIDISGQKPKPVSNFLGKETIFYIIVVCNKAQQTCPRIWPGLGDNNRYYWPLIDPSEADGTNNERLEVFRRVRNEIRAKLDDWIISH